VKPLWSIILDDFPDTRKALDRCSPDEWEALLDSSPDDVIPYLYPLYCWRRDGRQVAALTPHVVKGLMELPKAEVLLKIRECVFFQWPVTDWITKVLSVQDTERQRLVCPVGAYLYPDHQEARIVPVVLAYHPDRVQYLVQRSRPMSKHTTGLDTLIVRAYMAMTDERMSTRVRLAKKSRLRKAASRPDYRATVRRVELTPDYRAHWRTKLVGDASHPEQPEDRAPCRLHHVRAHTYRAWVKADEDGNPSNVRYLDCERDDAEPRPGLVAVRLPRRSCVRGQGEPMPARVSLVVAPTTPAAG